MYDYKVVRVHRVVDGDTWDLVLDLGFYQYGVYRVRLLGADTPEIYGRYASEGGQAAKEYVENWFAEREGKLIAKTRKADSFGRWLAEIWTEDGESLTETLIENGIAEPYP